MATATGVVAIEWFGDRAVLVRCADRPTRARLLPLLADTLPDLVVRPGMDTILVEAARPDPLLLDRVAAAPVPADRQPVTVAGVDSDRPARDVVVPVCYDGADLARVANALGVTEAAVVAAHTDQDWRVALLGFAPGFAYLEPAGALTAPWHRIGRRDSPRRRVPAGAVAAAAGCTAIYPRAMPGGWAILGRTDVAVFRPDMPSDPSLLHPGDRVRFERRP